MELCMDLGQAHPDGVIWISETEALLVLPSTTKVMSMMCLFGEALVWHNKSIRLHLHPPTDTYIRDYVALRNR